MYWPNPSDFSRILQTPQVAFRAAELKACQIEKNSLGQPRPRAGNFATVYRGMMPDGNSIAVRVFNLGRDERRERYEAISQYLSDRTLPCLVNFEYIEAGIRSPSDGKFYPLVTMEWVQGEVIFGWLARQCQRRDAVALLSAADQWVELVDQLRRAHIAHGDLQHGNIMVDEAGRLRLVDYDCMCVPELVGRKNLEIGVEPYQHPQRDNNTPLSLDLDNFSSLMILTALRALAAAPDLWRKYVDEPSYDKLLFRTSDFLDPHNSELYTDLMNSPDELVGELTSALLDAYRGAFERVPSLDEILDPFEKVEQLLVGQDWDGALQLLQRKGIEHDVPPRLHGAVREAVDRVDCRKALEAAIEAGNEVDIQRLYFPGLLDDYPAAQEAVQIARRAGEAIPALRRLRSVHQQKHWEAFVRTWDDYRSLLIGRKSAQRYEREAEQWRRRNTTLARLLALLEQADVNEIEKADVPAIAAAWRQLARLGGHPQGDALESQVHQLVRREKWRRAVARISNEPTEADDRNLVGLWDEQLLADWASAEPWRERYQQARGRLDALTLLRQAMDASASRPNTQSERTIVEAVSDLPPGYPHHFVERVLLAQRRLDAAAVLQEALDADGPERQIVSRWQQLTEVDGQTLAAENCKARVDLARCRIPVLARLARIDFHLPAAKLDELLIEAWDDELMRDCRDAARWLSPYEAARDRRVLIGRIEAALETADDRLIGQLVSDPLLHEYPLRSTWAGPIRLAQDRTRAVAQLIAAMDEGETERFVECFDVELLAKFKEDLVDYEPQIQDWVEMEMRSCERVGLRMAFHSPLVKIDRGSYRMRWSWPPSRLSNRCIITLSPREPGTNNDPLRLATDARVELTRDQWNAAGGSHVMEIEAAWGGDYVAAWAVIELGFATLYSEPLLLGQLPHTRASKRRKHP
ncbi:MAG: hypothetical protein IID44_04135 [Planctomycetes bacterium]|nr:hypothetical protein [Planctomycetota bacterium]